MDQRNVLNLLLQECEPCRYYHINIYVISENQAFEDIDIPQSPTVVVSKRSPLYQHSHLHEQDEVVIPVSTLIIKFSRIVCTYQF